jgi:hypothetical protein
LNAPRAPKRWLGGGLLLIALLTLLLVAPLFKYGRSNHPLAGMTSPDLCPLLPPQTPSPLGKLHTKSRGDDPTQSTCYYLDADDAEALRVSLSSTRELSVVAGGGADTEKIFATWMKEVRASYGNGEELPAPRQGWRHAGTWKGGAKRYLLFEDRGVLVLVESSRLDAAQLAAYAQQVQQALAKK